MTKTITLHLSGTSELVVRMALLLYLSECEKEKKKLEEKFGVATDEIEETIAQTKDVLQQLGWKPKEKGTAEVVDHTQQSLDLSSPSATPKKDEPPVADIPDPRTGRPRPTISRSQRPDKPLAILCGTENDKHNFTPKAEAGQQQCPICDRTWWVTTAADTGEILRCVDYPPDQPPPKPAA